MKTIALILSIILLSFNNISCAQSSTGIPEMEEIEFFTFLKSLLDDEQNLDILLDNDMKRRDVIVRIGNSMSIFNSDSIRVRVKNNANSTFKKNHKNDDTVISVRRIILKICDLYNKENENVASYLSEFKHTYPLQYIFKVYSQEKREILECHKSAKRLSPLTYEQNLKAIKKRISIIDGNNYCLYDSYYAEPKAFKSIEMYHDNDVFLQSIPGVNQDREYTGGFEFIVATDYLKWRFIRLRNKWIDNTLTYQTVSLGGQGYTPYIRYKNNFQMADSLFIYDRPFGSSVYIERSKNRLFRNGLVRQKGEFQVGMIGLSSGKRIQAKIHEDLTHESQFVHGWEQQIGQGGRLFFQLQQNWQFLLFSSHNRYKTIFMPRTIQKKENKKKIGANIIAEADAKFGTYYTSVGGGLRFSTMHFLSQSRNELISTSQRYRNMGFKFETGINYRYVVHNTMLEGLGLFNPFPFDENDKVNPDYYVLNEEEVNRHILTLDIGVNFRFRKTTIFIKQTIQSLEYESRLKNIDFSNPKFTSNLDPLDAHYYNEDVIREQENFLSRNFYGFGTLGINWIIE